MGRPLKIEWQETTEELYEKYKGEKDHQNRSRLQALWQVRQGKTMVEVAGQVGVHYRTVQEWISWYRQGGLDEVLARRHGGDHGGVESWLSAEQEAELKEQASAGDIRSIGAGMKWVEEAYGISYSYWGMRWVYQRLNLKLKVPRPKAPQSSSEVQEAWKKGG